MCHVLWNIVDCFVFLSIGPLFLLGSSCVGCEEDLRGIYLNTRTDMVILVPASVSVRKSTFKSSPKQPECIMLQGETGDILTFCTFRHAAFRRWKNFLFSASRVPLLAQLISFRGIELTGSADLCPRKSLYPHGRVIWSPWLGVSVTPPHCLSCCLHCFI